MVGTPPVARPDTATVLQATPVTVPVLQNDSPGVNGDGVEGTLDPASVRLVGAGGALVTTLTVPGVGTYTANPDGTITFTPVNTFTGTAPPVTYQVTGSFGNTARSTLTITANPAAPEANPDTATTPQNVNVTLNPAANDTPGQTGAAIAPASVRLLDGTGAPVTTLTTAAGTYTVDTATGAVTFDPVPGFTGTTAPVPYRVADVNGVTADSTITITVTPVTPDAEPDAVVTPANVPVTIPVLGNDTPGRPDAPLDPASVVLVDPATGAEVTTLTLAGVGTFTVNPATGAVTFTPAAGFTGSVPTVAYRVADANGTVAESSISVTVGTGPVARPDQPGTVQGRPVTFDPLANDSPGSGGAALDPASVRLLDPATGAPVTTVTIPGQGTFTVNPNGTITFTPVPTFAGETTPPVSYQVADANGALATGAIQVEVAAAPPTANPDEATTSQGNPVTIDPVTNDTPGVSGAALDRTTVRLIDPATGNPVTTLTVPGEGTFTVNTANGLVTFTPLPTFAGDEVVGYQIADANGTVVRSTITITVDALAPTAAPDTATTPGGTPVTTNVLANDTADPDAPIVPNTLRLVAPGGALVTTLGTAAGTYTANPNGTITFTPAAGFSGTAPAVTYSIADDNGTRATSTYTVTVGAGATAAPDAPTTSQGAPVTFDPLANDDPGEDGAGTPGSFVPGTLRLLDAAGNPVVTLGVAGVGTYTVNPNGTITFTPLPGFTGTAPAVTYQVQNTFGATASSTITVTVAAVTPVANPDTATTAQNVDVTTGVVANDTPGSATVPLVPASLRLVDGGTLVSTLTVPGVGTYTANPDGSITFDPVPAFTGPAPAVTYSVADANGTRVTSTYTVTVTAVTPVANPDTAGTPLGDPVTVDVLGNDTPGAPGAALVPGSVRLVGAGGSLVTTLATPAGTFTANPDGTITFTPAAGFTGPAPAVTYSVADANGTRVTSTLTVTVGGGAVAAPDTGTTLQGVAVTVPVLANDTPGDDGTGTPGTLVPATLRLLDAAGNPVTTLTVPGVGTYTATPGGTVTFTPVPAFTGTAPAVAYQVADSFGNVATGSLTVTVAPAAPAVAPDAPTTGQGQPVTFNPAANDGPGPSGAAVVPSTLRLLDAAGNPVTTLTVAGVGTYTVNPATGAVTFTPVPGFTGTAPPVTYRVLDANGVPGTSTITVTVTAITPIARPDSAVTPAGAPVTVNVLGNDSPGDPAEPLDPTSVRLLDAAGNPVTTLTLAGTGTFTVNTTTGAVTFTPAAGFTGAVPPVTYQVADANGTTAQSTLSVTVGLGPVARPDSPTTTQSQPVTFDPLANDSPGSGGAALDPTTVRLVDPATGTPVTTVTLAGVGTFTVNPATGAITFTPVPGFTGVTPPVTYQVADANGVVAQSAVQVTVAAAPPTANPDTATTPQGVPVTVNPAANDTPGASGAALDPASVFLLDPATGTYVRTVTLAGVGTFAADPATGVVTFTPVPAFTGTTPPVTYRIADANGSTATSTITVVVGPVVPVARPDTATTGQDVTVRTNVLGNDSPGDPADPLVPSTLRLVDANGALVTTLVVAGVGTYTANPDGTITFDPLPTFTGTAPAVTYSVADANGTRATSTYTVTVNADAPVARDDRVTTTPGQSVTIRVLGNDDGGSSGLDPATVQLIDPATGRPADTVTVAGVGTWTVNDDGTVTFTPAPGFEGEASIDYQVADAQGRLTTATITVDVEAVPTTPPTTPPTTTPPSTGPISPNPTSPTSPAPTSPGAPTPPVTNPPPQPAPNPPGGGGNGPLPNTGAAVLGVVGIGLIALAGGSVLAFASRRRRRDEVDAGLDIRDV